MANEEQLRILKREGVEAWNQWRKNNPDKEINLRGANLREKNLSGADFSEADIRSTNFKNANLQGVDFTRAKAGLQKRWVALLLAISFLLSVISGFLSFYLSFLITLSFNSSDPENFYIGLYTLIILVIFLIITFRKGLVAVAFAFAFAFAGGVGFAIAFNYAFAFAYVGALAGAGGVAIAGAFAVAGTFAFAGAFAFALPGAFAFVGALAGAGGVAIAFAGAFAFALFGFYIGWRALKGDDRDVWVRSFAVAFAATGGTNFQGSNLTDAIFTRATLKNTDFRKAILTRTGFRKAKKLDLARPGNTYLKSLKIQQWLTGTGQDNNFDRQDLRGVNFQGKILTDASFIGADLSNANLQDADLSGAKLVKTQLDGTDFRGATLTGACIEDWGITSNTILNRVKCEYIYMRLPTQEDPDPHRKPDNRQEIFADGDFADFIKPIFDTLDLYHNQNVDPRAIAISWKKLAEKHPDADLRFASMEVKGEDNLLLRLITSLDTDKSQLSAEYFEEYNRIKALNEANKKLLTEKNERIKKLENMVKLALRSPKYYSEGDHIEGDKTDRSRKIEVSDGTVNASGSGAFSLGDINGTVANTINQLPSSSNPNEPGIKELLTQLQQAIDDPQLSEEDQKQTLEQIQTLAEAGQNPQKETMQKKAKKAVGFLKVIAEGIEPATKLAQACATVLPKILLFFGLSI